MRYFLTKGKLPVTTLIMLLQMTLVHCSNYITQNQEHLTTQTNFSTSKHKDKCECINQKGHKISMEKLKNVGVSQSSNLVNYEKISNFLRKRLHMDQLGIRNSRTGLSPIANYYGTCNHGESTSECRCRIRDGCGAFRILQNGKLAVIDPVYAYSNVFFTGVSPCVSTLSPDGKSLDFDFSGMYVEVKDHRDLLESMNDKMNEAVYSLLSSPAAFPGNCQNFDALGQRSQNLLSYMTSEGGLLCEIAATKAGTIHCQARKKPLQSSGHTSLEAMKTTHSCSEAFLTEHGKTWTFCAIMDNNLLGRLAKASCSSHLIENIQSFRKDEGLKYGNVYCKYSHLANSCLSLLDIQEIHECKESFELSFQNVAGKSFVGCKFISTSLSAFENEYGQISFENHPLPKILSLEQAEAVWLTSHNNSSSFSLDVSIKKTLERQSLIQEPIKDLSICNL